MSQRGGGISLVAIAAGAFIEGIAVFRTGRSHHGWGIIVGHSGFVGLNYHTLAGTQAVCVIGIGDAGIGIAVGGGRFHQASALCPVKAPPPAVKIAGRIAADGVARYGIGCGIVGLAFIGDGFAVKGGEQIPPLGVFIGVGIGIVIAGVVGTSHRYTLQIPRLVIGIAVAQVFAGEDCACKLPQSVVGIGILCIVILGCGSDIAQSVIGIIPGNVIQQAVILDASHLGGGSGGAHVPVGIVFGVKGGAHAGQPLQRVIGKLQFVDRALCGNVYQAAVLFVVGKRLGVRAIAYLPALGTDPVAVVVFPMYLQLGFNTAGDLAVDGSAQGIVGIGVDGALSARAVCDGGNLPVAGIGVGKFSAAGIAGFGDAVQIIVLESHFVAVAIGLLLEAAVFCGVLVACQKDFAHLDAGEIAKRVVGIGKALGFTGGIRPGHAGENTVCISICQTALVGEGFLGNAAKIVIGHGGCVVFRVYDGGCLPGHAAHGGIIGIGDLLIGGIRHIAHQIVVRRINRAGLQGFGEAGGIAFQGRAGDVAGNVIGHALGHNVVCDGFQAVLVGFIVGVGKSAVAAGNGFNEVAVFIGVRVGFQPCGGDGFQIALFVIAHSLSGFPHQGQIVEPRGIGIFLVGAFHPDGGNRLVRLPGHDGEGGKLPVGKVGVKGSVVVLHSAAGIGQHRPEAELLVFVLGGGFLVGFRVAVHFIVRDGVAHGPAGKHIGLRAGQVHRDGLGGIVILLGIAGNANGIVAVRTGAAGSGVHGPTVGSPFQIAVFQKVYIGGCLRAQHAAGLF